MDLSFLRIAVCGGVIEYNGLFKFHARLPLPCAFWTAGRLERNYEARKEKAKKKDLEPFWGKIIEIDYSTPDWELRTVELQKGVPGGLCPRWGFSLIVAKFPRGSARSPRRESFSLPHRKPSEPAQRPRSRPACLLARDY